MELFFRIDWILLRYSEKGSSGLSKNSQGNTSGEPKRASGAEIAESEVITDGTPKVGIQDRSKALAHSSAVLDWRGIASGHPLVLSTMVNKKVCPQD